MSATGAFILPLPSLTDREGKVKVVVTLDNQGGEEAQTSIQTEIFELAADGVAGKESGGFGLGHATDRRR